MGKGKLILAAIVAAAVGTGYYFKDNISSYYNQQIEYSKKQQERTIPYSDSLLNKNLGSDEKNNNFYRFKLNGTDIAIEVGAKDSLTTTKKDSLTTKVDSLVIEPEDINLSTKEGKFPIYSIKRKILK